ncbi:uncharacterized protein N7500_008549 [Penicillium coprophilum]|uniref:uncharacterized protein n=1 Tax=Penicillium coprophilum TaxID=36646 RepID=UPI0023A17EE2|nr:uncharacterized protein N7500_008549 [Penicillium coprophilum]KAJ5158898.1 hypothetical protein N7500_008549 [Penicillium coprophilum]
MIASGFGITIIILYLKKMIYDIITAAQSLLNALLEDDIIDKGYILSISIYIENGLAYNKTLFGKYKRVYFYQGEPDYHSIVSLKVERLPNIRDKRGQTLIMVSTLDNLRDYIQEIVRGHLYQDITLLELEY